MKLGPRAKLLLLVGLFMLPIAASILAYNFLRPNPTANYGELLSPPDTITSQRFSRPDGSAFTFAELAGRWILVVSDSGDCPEACRDKLVALRQVRLGLGRNASRVERVLVIDDTREPDPSVAAPFPGMIVARTPTGMQVAPGAANDRAYIYLVDPHGNVMMRWPQAPDGRRMLKDLERLLKASQIG